MPEAGKIIVGIDYDGVVIHKAKQWNIFGRATKMGLPNMPGVVDGITALKQASDVVVLGVRTVRPKWLRKRQTASQIEKRGFPIESVTHTTNSSMEKIARLLLDAHTMPEGQPPVKGDGIYLPSSNVKQVVLIDDSIEKVVAAAEELYDKHEEYRKLLQTFTLAAFNPKQPEKLKGLIVPGKIHVVSMQSWSDVDKMLDEVRRTTK